MSGSCQSQHETLQYVGNFLFAVLQKLLLQSLSNELDACKQRKPFLLFVVPQFLLQIFLRVKADLFFRQNDSGKNKV